MVVFDCDPFTYAPFVESSPSCSQGVVLLFHDIVTAKKHVPSLLFGRAGVRH